MTRAVIYARYSSAKQNAASIDDQVRVCEAIAQRNGWSIQKVYADPEISGTLRNRPSLLELIDDAKAGWIDVVISESLDRLARDLEDASWIGKRLSYSGARIVTHAEGEICEMKIAVAGLLGSLYVKNLAQKTWRGLEGAVLAGRMAGGRTYGYEVFSEIGPNGRPVNGLLRISDVEAATVRDIFQRFAAGASAIQIAKHLNECGAKSPRGGAWNASTIRGDPKKLVGILNNPLYRGQLIWNRRQWRKNPETVERRRTYRLRPMSEWVTVDLPDLQIVPDELMTRVQARLSALKRSDGSGMHTRRRQKHLLSGLARCGQCGANYVISGKDYYRCAGHKERGTCKNGHSVRQHALENGVLAGLQSHLLTPELAEVFVGEFNREITRLQKGGIAQAVPEARLKVVQVQIDNIVSAIAAGIPSIALKERLSALETDKAALVVEAAEAGPTATPMAMPSAAQLISIYRNKVSYLRDSLDREDVRLEASQVLRGLIDDIVIYPVGDRTEVELVGDIAKLTTWAANENSRSDDNLSGRSSMVVAGTGFEPVTFRL